ncbi:MAG: hypothetical protein AB2813_06580 [Candidatus Sedimenticola endophacoides]
MPRCTLQPEFGQRHLQGVQAEPFDPQSIAGGGIRPVEIEFQAHSTGAPTRTLQPPQAQDESIGRLWRRGVAEREQRQRRQPP